MHTTPRFPQGRYSLEGKGLDPGTTIEAHPAGTVIIDVGMVEA